MIAATTEKQRNLKAIITERWQIPSQMPFSYADTLTEGGRAKPGDVRPDDSMTWSFYGGTLDIKNRTLEQQPFRLRHGAAKADDDDGRPRQPAGRPGGRAGASRPDDGATIARG